MSPKAGRAAKRQQLMRTKHGAGQGPFHGRKERRTEEGKALRQITSSIGMAEQLLRSRLDENPLVKRVLGEAVSDTAWTGHDLVIEGGDRGLNVRMPRQWVKDVLQVISTCFMVQFTIMPRGKRTVLRINGRPLHVERAVIAVTDLLINANELAWQVYDRAYRGAKQKGKVRKAQGNRAEFTHRYAVSLRKDLDRMLEKLSQEYGAQAVTELLHTDESHRQLMEVAR